MTELQMFVAYVGPLSVIAGAAWKMSARLARMEERLAALEKENRELKSDITALRTLLSVLVDSRRSAG